MSSVSNMNVGKCHDDLAIADHGYVAGNNRFLVCFGIGGVDGETWTRDGVKMDRSDIHKFLYYSPPGETLVSFGYETYFDDEVTRTCRLYVVADGVDPSDEMKYSKTVEDCVQDYYSYYSSLNDFDMIKKFGVVHNVSILPGMPGGVCSDAYQPTKLIAVSSHGLDMIGQFHGKERKWGIGNMATLLSKSSAVAQYLASL